MNKTLLIAGKLVGVGQKPYLIAEAGVNHNGSLQLALKLVDAAAAAGADAVKFQTFRAHQVVTAQGEMAAYQKKNLGVSERQIEMIKKLELDERHYPALLRRCRQRNITFLSAPHGGVASLRFLVQLKLPAFKIGSGDLTNLPLLEAAGKTKKPIIISTGMATMTEIREAVQTIQRTGNRNIAILHCTTDYPCKLDEVNLRAMVTLQYSFPLPVGYSDHTRGIDVSLYAVAAGATIIEKHFTIDRSLPGPDQRSSLEPPALTRLAREMSRLHTIMGSSQKKPSASERLMKPLVRKSLVTMKSIRIGETFNERTLGIKRPGTGLHPRNYCHVLGKRARRDLVADHLLRKDDFDR